MDVTGSYNKRDTINIFDVPRIELEKIAEKTGEMVIEGRHYLVLNLYFGELEISLFSKGEGL